MNSQSPIGIFDSGVGGLTVFKALGHLLPSEQLLYFGDTLHLPYGDKSPEEIQRYSLESCRFLENHGIKLLIIACHTVSTTAFDHLQAHLSVPLIGIHTPSLEATCQMNTHPFPHIAILGTSATINSQFYQHALQERLPQATLFPLACPRFVPLIEADLSLESAMQETLAPLQSTPLHSLLLACTHYPLIEHQIQQLLPSLTTINPADACAEHAATFLQSHNLLNTSHSSPTHRFFVSSNPDQFQRHANLFLTDPVEGLSLI